jgi:hypothetical protein
MKALTETAVVTDPSPAPSAALASNALASDAPVFDTRASNGRRVADGRDPIVRLGVKNGPRYAFSTQPIVRMTGRGTPSAGLPISAAASNVVAVAREDSLPWEGELAKQPLAVLQRTVREACAGWSRSKRAEAIVKLDVRVRASIPSYRFGWI